jgi:chromate reductase
VQFTEYDGLKLLAPFDEDDEPAPALAVTQRRDAIARANAILRAWPEYNSSIPGQLKNAVDWASRPVNDAVVRNRPVAVIGASGKRMRRSVETSRAVCNSGSYAT